MSEWIVGVDSHAQSLTAVQVDAVGRVRASCTEPNSPAGHERLLAWGARAPAGCRWAVEGTGGHGRPLTRVLQAAGLPVHEVPGWRTARARRHGRRPEKSDLADATAIARVLVQDAMVAMARGEDVTTILRLLLEERERLVGQRTALINQLRASLRQLGGRFDRQAGPLRRARGARRVLALQPAGLDLVGQAQLAHAHRQATRLLGLHQDIAELTAALTQRIQQLRPRLLELPGCGPLTAAWLLAETGDPRAFRSAAAYAAFSGTAPRLASSGANQRHRLNRLGNRRLNRALHLIALTQTRMRGSGGRTYVERRATEGKTPREAMRALKRHLARVVFKSLYHDVTSGRLSLALT